MLTARLVAAAAGLLPVADRGRYLEEFRSELTDLARAGGSRWAQVGYSVRLLASAWRLRAELRSPRRRGATQ